MLNEKILFLISATITWIHDVLLNNATSDARRGQQTSLTRQARCELGNDQATSIDCVQQQKKNGIYIHKSAKAAVKICTHDTI